MTPLVHTIGHSTRTTSELLELLRAHDVRVLVDVRRHPGSRRHPQFGKEALKAALDVAGIEYVHEEGLGGRRRGRADSPNRALRSAGFRAYADHMAAREFRAALDRLLALARRSRPAVMCAEALPWRCHRWLLSDALVARGAEVRHILSAEEARPHELNAEARIGGEGFIVYDGRAQDEPEAAAGPTGGGAQIDLIPGPEDGPWSA